MRVRELEENLDAYERTVKQADVAHARTREELDALRACIEQGICLYAGPGRGDCEHFIGLPGKTIAGQHDGPDSTVDAYGKPNGWCWSCWRSYQLERKK